MLDGDPVGDRRAHRLVPREGCTGRRLLTNHAQLGTKGSERDRDARDESPAPHRHDDRPWALGQLLDELEPERPLAGDHAGSSKACTKVAPVSRSIALAAASASS